MPTDWSNLSAILTRREYNAVIGDRHHGATAPLDPQTCHCESPGFTLDSDDGEVRCWKCGARPTEAAASRS